MQHHFKKLCVWTTVLFLSGNLTLLEAGDQTELKTAIQQGEQSYVRLVSKLSAKMNYVATLDGNDMIQLTREHIQDNKNGMYIYSLIFNKYAIESDRQDVSSLVGISRLRKNYRQNLDLRKATPQAPWVIVRDISEPLTEENQDLKYEVATVLRNIHCECLRCFPHHFLMTVGELLDVAGFRLNSQSEERVGSERLVTLDFTVELSLNQKAPKTFIRSGRLKLRPDAYWTVHSGIIQVDAGFLGGKIIDCEVKNTYHHELEKRMLPKEVKAVCTVITKDKKNAKAVCQGTFEFMTHETLPDERFSLTQLGMTEREPIINVSSNASEPAPILDTKNHTYVAPYSIIPSYVWITSLGILVFLLGIALRIAVARSKRDIATSGKPLPKT